MIGVGKSVLSMQKHFTWVSIIFFLPSYIISSAEEIVIAEWKCESECMSIFSLILSRTCI